MCMRAYDVYRGNGRAHAIAVKNNVPYLSESKRTPLKRVPSAWLRDERSAAHSRLEANK